MKIAIDAETDRCTDHKELQLCRKVNSDKLAHRFNCSLARMICKTSFIGFFNLSKSSYSFEWHLIPTELHEKLIEKLASNVESGILRCHIKSHWLELLKNVNYIPRYLKTVEQVFWFPKQPKVRLNYPNPNMTSAYPSISIIFLDSFSRTVFYRTLPKTIAFLKDLNRQGKRKVLDYKLFQSIDTHTYWHLYNLFDGPKAEIRNSLLTKQYL